MHSRTRPQSRPHLPRRGKPTGSSLPYLSSFPFAFPGASFPILMKVSGVERSGASNTPVHCQCQYYNTSLKYCILQHGETIQFFCHRPHFLYHILLVFPLRQVGNIAVPGQYIRIFLHVPQYPRPCPICRLSISVCISNTACQPWKQYSANAYPIQRASRIPIYPISSLLNDRI